MQNVHKLCKKELKKRFLAIFSSVVARSDSRSQMMVVLNVSQHMAVVVGDAQLNRYA